MMKNDEKKCPLSYAHFCYGPECALWIGDECGLLAQSRAAENAANELYHIRRALEEKL